MRSFINRLEVSPVAARVGPFVVFAALTVCQGKFGEASRYWFYFGKILVGGWLIWLVRPLVAEMKWKCSWEAVLVGVAVFAMWVGIDDFYSPLYRVLDRLLAYRGLAKAKSGAELASEGWNPHTQFGQDSALAWMLIGVRLLGSSMVVPPLEEVFYRSFLYRYILKPDFQSVPLGRFAWTPFVVTSALFGISHREWLAGILCGLTYQGLVCWKKRLGDAMTAHAITNFLLDLWVIWRGTWHFW